MKKILVFELNWLGDIIFSVPLLKALKENDDVHLTCAVVPRYAELLNFCSDVDEIILLDDKRGLIGLFDRLKFFFKISRLNFDTCVLLKPSRSKLLLSKLASIKNRVGFIGKNDKDLTVKVVSQMEALHRTDNMLLLAGAMGMKIKEKRYELEVDPNTPNPVLDKLPSGKIIVSLNPGGNWDPKRWPREKHALLAKKTLELDENILIVLTGAKKDIILTDFIKNETGSDRVFIAAGETSLKDLACIFKASDLVISADSGPLHLASAVKAKTVSLFGPTSPELTGVRGKGENVTIFSDLDCRIPCYLDCCPLNNKCMEDITVEEVILSVKKLLRSRIEQEKDNN